MLSDGDAPNEVLEIFERAESLARMEPRVHFRHGATEKEYRRSAVEEA